MSQFDSELDANESRAAFDSLARSPVGLNTAKSLMKLIKAVVIPDPSSLEEAGKEVVSSLREDRESVDATELKYLVDTVVLTVRRHEGALGGLGERLEKAEKRLEEGLKMAVRFPTDGTPQTLGRLAIVIVRGALDFSDRPQEQTAEFLRIAAQITDSEMNFLGILHESQGKLPPPGKIDSREIWIHNVQRLWAQMNKLHSPGEEGWMHRKSMCVRLQSYGFLEQVERTSTAEGSEVGQAPYVLLPLGREFYEYTRFES